jgi:hypothetical protein
MELFLLINFIICVLVLIGFVFAIISETGNDRER